MLWVQQVDAIQMGTHIISLYKQVDKKYTGCNLKTTQLINCALIRICAVIRLQTVCDVVLQNILNIAILFHYKIDIAQV